MRVPSLRRAGFAATLVTGACLLGAGVNGLAGLNSDLRVATEPSSTLVRETWHAPGGPECDGPRYGADRRT